VSDGDNNRRTALGSRPLLLVALMAGRPSKQATVGAMQYQCGSAQSACTHAAFVEFGSATLQAVRSRPRFPALAAADPGAKARLCVSSVLWVPRRREKDGRVPAGITRPEELSADPRVASRISGVGG
jgi:hypothetical protein